MKRKLDECDVPVGPEEAFTTLGLDARLLQALQREKYADPTPVQAKAIPLALAGKDILARSKTGSGKTAAYAIPILQSLLKRKSSSPAQCTSALILVPTRELAGQVTKVFESLASFCSGDIRVENLTRKEDEKVQRARLSGSPDIVVATPARAALNMSNGALGLGSLAHLAIDEADLVLSYGHGRDLDAIAKSMPTGVQTILMSATLQPEVDSLKRIFCQEPVILEMDDEEMESGNLSQYTVRCAEDEKFLLIYAIFMLKLIKGKCIVFVGDIDRCYRLKLFLEQFGIKSCVLNSELPVNSRIHVVEEFNKNVYQIIIASDEHEVLGGEEGSSKQSHKKPVEEADGGKGGDPTKAKESEDRPKKKQKRARSDKEYGIARGIDFKNVACVLNFDLPTNSRSYTHRIGRTARAGKTGIALSFVIPKDQYRKHKPTSFPTTQHDEEVMENIQKEQKKKGQSVQPYHFDMKRLDGFRYRIGDAIRAVTGIAVREARVRELRQELLKSEKLKRHFEENPEELRHLRHDGEMRTARMQSHLKHVPDYLLPGGSKKALEHDAGFVGFSKESENRIRKARAHNKFKKKGKGGKKADPLKTFNAKGRR